MISDAAAIAREHTPENPTAVGTQPGGPQQDAQTLTGPAATLIPSGQALELIGHGLHYGTLHRWVRLHAITPTQPPQGKGSDTGWSPRDVLCLEAIAKVRDDLNALHLPCPHHLVHQLWTDLHEWGEADLYRETISITVHLGSETA